MAVYFIFISCILQKFSQLILVQRFSRMARTKRKAQKAAARQRRAEEKAAQTAAESGQSKEEAAKEEVVSAAELDVPKAKKIKLDDTSATSTVAENNDIVDTKEPSSQSQSESPQTLPDIQSAVEPPEKKEPTIAKDKRRTLVLNYWLRSLWLTDIS